MQGYSNSLRLQRGISSNEINLIAYAGDHIDVGITNVDDSDFKNDILSIAGIDSSAIEFVDFEITWSGFAPEPPSGNGISAYGTTYRMGDIISLGSAGYGTMGCPTDSSGNYFYTANHGAVSIGNVVKSGGTDIGSVDKISLSSTTDCSRVNLSSYGNKVSAALYSYKASTPAVATFVTAYTGYSGAISGLIYATSAQVTNPSGSPMSDMIVVSMGSQAGDSGACLVSTGIYGDSAIGILSFGATLNGNPVTVFSKITNFPF